MEASKNKNSVDSEIDLLIKGYTLMLEKIGRALRSDVVTMVNDFLRRLKNPEGDYLNCRIFLFIGNMFNELESLTSEDNGSIINEETPLSHMISQFNCESNWESLAKIDMTVIGSLNQLFLKSTAIKKMFLNVLKKDCEKSEGNENISNTQLSSGLSILLLQFKWCADYSHDNKIINEYVSDLLAHGDCDLRVTTQIVGKNITNIYSNYSIKKYYPPHLIDSLNNYDNSTVEQLIYKMDLPTQFIAPFLDFIAWGCSKLSIDFMQLLIHFNENDHGYFKEIERKNYDEFYDRWSNFFLIIAMNCQYNSSGS